MLHCTQASKHASFAHSLSAQPARCCCCCFACLPEPSLNTYSIFLSPSSTQASPRQPSAPCSDAPLRLLGCLLGCLLCLPIRSFSSLSHSSSARPAPSPTLFALCSCNWPPSQDSTFPILSSVSAPAPAPAPATQQPSSAASDHSCGLLPSAPSLSPPLPPSSSSSSSTLLFSLYFLPGIHILPSASISQQQAHRFGSFPARQFARHC